VSASRKSQRPDNYDPPKISTAKKRTDSAQRVPLFYIDGKEYSVPVNLPPALGLRYMRRVRDGASHVEAAMFLFMEAIGEDALNALCECEEVDRNAMEKIVERVLEIALGGAPQGKSPTD
jgi:hypothetical protein